MSAGQGPVEHFKQFYSMLLQAFPDATMEINEQLAERGLPPSGNQIEWEFIDIFRIRDAKLVEHWTHMDFEALRSQMRGR